MKNGTIRIKCLLLALLLLLSSTLASCGSYYREYGFTGVYLRHGTFEFGGGDFLIGDEFRFGEYQHTLNALKGTKSFDVLGETFTCEYERTYTFSYTSEPIHRYNEIGPNGYTGLNIETDSRGNIHKLSIPINHKLTNYKYMYEYEVILDIAKKYVGKLNPNINLDEFVFYYYGDPENDDRFEFFWKKCVSGVNMEVVEVYIDMFGNLNGFQYSVCDATHVPEISEAQLIEIAEAKMRDTLEKAGYEVSCFKNTRIPKDSISVPDLSMGASEKHTYKVIYFRPLASYALWFDVYSTVVLEDGRENNVFHDMILTYK